MNEEVIHIRQDAAPHEGVPRGSAPIEKLIHLALPVRLTHMQNGGRGAPELACTYDIHPRGARLLSSREVNVGDLVTVERGRTKSVCRVVWTADPGSALRGQFTVECVEGNRIPWEDELRQMEEQYLPVIPALPNGTSAMNFRRGTQNRRRRPRYQVEGGADVAEIGGVSRVEGRLEEISEFGCLISAGDLLTPGTGLRLVLNMCDVSVALRGHVRYTAQNRAMGVEFQEIRQGDRPLLDYVLTRLRKPRVEDFADLEVVTEHLAAVAG
ncbi:MAG TPA: PilZ domain-containing protein [Candidatus Acidoferrum sp.]|nr:PilZ domain-containing protein [Candidatus Acidoferrum sp.]